MKITDVKTVLLTGPLTQDPSLGGLQKYRSAAFVEIHTDVGTVGIGETYCGYFAPDIVPVVVNFFRPILVGLSERDLDVNRLWSRMYHCGNFWCRTGLGVNVLAGIEGALWDLKGKLAGLPVVELLGGCLYDRLPAYATGGISNYPPDELWRKIDRYREVGFRACKIGAGWHDSANDRFIDGRSAVGWTELEAEKFEKLRSHVGPDFKLCLDGHMANPQGGLASGWDVGTAKAVCRALEPYDLLFVEEPLDYHNLSGYAELCRDGSVTIAGGECLTTREEFLQFAHAGAFGLVQPDASFIGMSAFVDVAKMFANLGRAVATHAWSAGVGVMENIHAAFASPNVVILELPPLAGPLHTEVYGDGYRFEEGFVLRPEGPGLGVRLTDTVKNKYPFIPGSGEWNPVPGKCTLL